MGAKASLVFLKVIVLLDEGVCVDTGLSLWAFLLLFYVSTHIGLIEVSIALSIFGVVIVGAMFVVMIFRYVARVNLEDFEIEVLNKNGITLTIGAV